MDGVAVTVGKVSAFAAWSQFKTLCASEFALGNVASSPCSASKARIARAAVRMSSEMQLPPWSMSTVAMNGGRGMMGRKFFGTALARITRALTASMVSTVLRVVHAGTAEL